MKWRVHLKGWVAFALLACWTAGPASAVTTNNFDAPGTPFTGASNNGGALPVVLGGGPSGNYLQLMPDNVGGLLNTAAFDQTDPGSVAQQITFGFALPTEASHTGCCDQRADGFAVAVVGPGTYGTSGALNPGATAWERPQLPDSFAIGFDIFEGGNNNVYSINVNGAQLATSTINDSTMQLTNGIPKLATIDYSVDSSGTVPKTTVSMRLDEVGTGNSVQVFNNVEVLGAPPVGGRLAFGGRTGGAFTAVGIDDVNATFTPSAPLAPLITNGMVAPGDDGLIHVYLLNATDLTWAQANTAAENQTFRGQSGHLVSITSDRENAIANSLGGGDRWIGLTDNEAFGGSEAGSNPNGGWVWTSGEPFAYQNFAGGEPNNSGGEDAAHLRGDGLWNDNASGLPGDRGGPPAFDSIVEFAVAANNPLNLEGSMQGFNVRQVNSPSGGWANIGAARAFLDANPGGIMDMPDTIDYVDPQSGAGAHFGVNNPFPGDTGGDDNDFAMEATTHIWVPFPGVWTFGVNSDDGFSLDIEGAVLESVVNGDDNNGVLEFPNPRGSADTLGVFSFPGQGFYPLTLSWFENGGGANAELFSAFGAKGGFDSTFRLVGDFDNGGLLALKTLPIPEPGTAGLALMAIGALGLRRRRRTA